MCRRCDEARKRFWKKLTPAMQRREKRIEQVWERYWKETRQEEVRLIKAREACEDKKVK